MPNPFDSDPRGPSTAKLLALGICFVLIAVTVSAALIAKSQGRLDRLVRVTAELVNVGDGLPAKSDVKFRGVLVGFVEHVTPARAGQANTVHIGLTPAFASTIPDTVTARVVPSNVFAVSSVQLVPNGPGSPVRPGAVIPEDTTLPTVLFQTFTEKLRQVLAAVGRKPDTNSMGALTALGQAAQGRGPRLREAAGQLNSIVAELNNLVPTDPGPSTMSALTDAANGLKTAAPALFDAVGDAIRPAKTLAEKRLQLANLLSGGLATTGTLRDAFDHQTDRLINITTELTPVVGVLADNARQFPQIFSRLQRLADKALSVWDPRTNAFSLYGTIALTPTRQYVRADCPRYAELLGLSCFTAPEVPTAPNLLPALASHGYPPTPGVPENRLNLAPPRDSLGSIGHFDDPHPAPVDPPPAVPAQAPPSQAPLPAKSPPPPATQPAPASVTVPSPVVQQQSAHASGDIGPVGSRQQSQQLSSIVGDPANAATVLLGPLTRGATVHLTQGGYR